MKSGKDSERYRKFVKTKKKVPWRQWEYQSENTRAYDTFFKGCGHTLFRIPYTLDYAISDSEFQANHYANCDPKNCTMYDQYCSEMDFLHYSRFTPPNIRPVNRNYCFVMGRDSGIHGPLTFHEWKEYSWSLLDSFFELKDDENALTEQNIHQQWAKIYFRHPKDFIGGHYGLYSDILLILCAYFADTYTKHRAYADVWEGSDLYENIEPVDYQDARPFRDHGKVFNFTVLHKTNAKKQSVDSTIPPEVLREQDRAAVNRFKTRLKNGDDCLTSYTDPQGDPYTSWYKLAKHVPLRVIDGVVKPAIFPNNESLIDTYWEESLATIQGFFDCNCIELMPEGYVPDLSGKTHSFGSVEIHNSFSPIRSC